MGWLPTSGFDTEIVEPPSRGGSKVWRYYMKANGKSGKREITFVDDTRLYYVHTDENGDYLETPKILTPKEAQELMKTRPDPMAGGPLASPVVIMEHNMALKGKWGNYFTCLAQIGKPCPACEAGDVASQVALFTIIDHTERKDKNGKVHKDEIKVLWVKTSQAVYKLLQDQAAKKGRAGLRGVRYEVQRLGDKTPACGDSFDFSERVELPDDIQPINYVQFIEPLTPKAMADQVGVAAHGEDTPVDY